MKTTHLLLAIIIAPLFVGCCTTSPHRDLSIRPTTNAIPIDSFADALREHMPVLLVTNHVPGAVVSYIKNGEVAWTMAFGLANLQTGAPMQSDMVFNHGSDGKTLTAWGVMRLVEEGKVDLDAPANRYLKRWQIRSTKFDADGVTIRRLLSHTAGLTVHGTTDYSRWERFPSLLQVLEGKNQNEGAVVIKWRPGSTNVYSSGGFAILQMVIEDVTGEAFAEFIQREVANPLGLSSLEWAWTSQLERRAPTPYDWRQKKVGYWQPACQAVGSEICTVPDFARFVAAAAPGPHGEPPGRGVLKAETIAAMIEIQPNAGPLHSGLGYGVTSYKGEKFLKHEGLRTSGWSAEFVIDANRGEGFVIANNSFLGSSLNKAVEKIWIEKIVNEIDNDHR